MPISRKTRSPCPTSSSTDSRRRVSGLSFLSVYVSATWTKPWPRALPRGLRAPHRRFRLTMLPMAHLYVSISSPRQSPSPQRRQPCKRRSSPSSATTMRPLLATLSEGDGLDRGAISAISRYRCAYLISQGHLESARGAEHRPLHAWSGRQNQPINGETVCVPSRPLRLHEPTHEAELVS